MLRFILFLAFIICSSAVQNTFAQMYSNDGQVKNLQRYDINPYHFGFTLGFNQMNFAVSKFKDYRKIDTLYTVTPQSESGFNIGIVSNLRLGTFWDLRFIPSLYFGERRLLYSYLYKNQIVNNFQSIQSNLLDFPLLFKYKSARMINTRVYVLAGGAYTLDLASLSKKTQELNQALVRLKRDDFTYQIGVGFDFYLVYFKFSTELKMEFGTQNLLKRDNNIFDNSIDKLQSKMLILSFTFE